jgi:hypothetical protein
MGQFETIVTLSGLAGPPYPWSVSDAMPLGIGTGGHKSEWMGCNTTSNLHVSFVAVLQHAMVYVRFSEDGFRKCATKDLDESDANIFGKLKDASDDGCEVVEMCKLYRAGHYCCAISGCGALPFRFAQLPVSPPASVATMQTLQYTWITPFHRDGQQGRPGLFAVGALV